MTYFPLNQNWRMKAAIIFCLITAWAAMAARGQTVADTSTNDATVTVYKKMSLEQLMDLDVTSVAKQPEPYGRAPAAIQVVTGDEIRRSGASSLPEALRLADNLEVAQKNSHDWGISARGFNTSLANKLLVLVDGRSVYTPLYSGVFWDTQDYLLEDIDRIEVISGPGGTLWGANAVNGVINITTKSAKDTQGLYTEAGGGSWLQDFAGVRYGGVLTSNIFYRVYGKYFDRTSEVFSNGASAGDAWRSGQGGFRIDDEAVAHNTFTVQGDFYLGDENAAMNAHSKTGGGNILGRWSHEFADDSDMQLQLYYDRKYLHDNVPALQVGSLVLAPAGVFTDGLDTYDVDFQHRFKLGERNRIVWGLGYRFTQEVEGNAPSLAFFPALQNQNLYSGFVQDEIMLCNDVFFTLGTKIEHNDYTHFEYEPSARLQWSATPNQMFWGAISRAVRTPSRIDRDLSEGEPPYFVLLSGGKNFESENLIAYELGYRAQLFSKVTASASAFYNDYDDIRSTAFSPVTVFPLFFQNNVEGETYGVELSVSCQMLGWWRLHAGYDYLKEQLRIKPGQMDFNNALNETADPQHQFSIRSSMDLPGNVEFDTGLRWVDTLHNNDGPNVGTVPSYFELDARLAWHPTKNLELAVVGQNLLHNHHPEYGFPNATREEITRSVYGKVSFRW